LPPIASMVSALTECTADSTAGNNSTPMELLAPAGSLAAFEAALEQGADAIYVGAPGCNARALSRDFTLSEIKAMIRQAHAQGRRLYIAMNSLIREDEIKNVLEMLSCLSQMGPDALIIQDLGLLHLARTWFPELALHASTLMSVHNSLAARELTRLGCARVVLARELTIEEMAAIHRATGAELEVFVHGAMCFSYSGLCLFSSLHGGKSSLRGQCVQPCRRTYQYRNSRGRPGHRGGYLFSMHDLCGIDFLPELRDAGVRSLKIEGRMKSASYVANTVAAYRMALDSLDAPEDEQERMLCQAHQLLDQAMARKRGSGFLLSDRPPAAVSPNISGSSGTFVGKAKLTRSGRGAPGLELTLTTPLAVGDRLRMLLEPSGRQQSFTLRHLFVSGRKHNKAAPGERVTIVLPSQRDGIPAGQAHASLFKVDVGRRITMERAARRKWSTGRECAIEPDTKKIKAVLRVLFPHTAAPGRNRQRRGHSRTPGRSGQARFTVLLARLSDLRQRLPVRPAQVILPLDRENMRILARQKGKKGQIRLCWLLPPVIQEKDLAWYQHQVGELLGRGYRRFMLGHVTQVGLFRNLNQQDGGRLELSGYYTLNVLNSAAVRLLGQLGLSSVLFSIETDRDNLSLALRHLGTAARTKKRGRHGSGPIPAVGMYVYGRPPLFTSRLDSTHFRYQNRFVSPRQEEFILEQRHDLTLARSVLPFSLLTWQEELTRLGIAFQLVDLSGGPVKQEIAMLRNLLGRGKRGIRVLTGNYQATLS